MNKEQKILYLITKSNYGGAQKYVFELATGAKERGYTTEVACGGTGETGAPTGLLVEKLAHANIPVHLVHSFMRDVSFGRDLRAFLEIFALLRRTRPDVLHISSSKAGGVGALAGRLAGVPKIIFTIHGLPSDESWRPRWQLFFISLATEITIRLAHQNIAISSDIYRRLSSKIKSSNKLILINNGIAPISFVDQKTAREALGLMVAGGTFWIGGIGELHPNKNWQAAIHALTSLPKQVHLCIVGTGEEYQSLKHLAQKLSVAERVHLVGYKDNAYALLTAFDIFVLPSKKEGLPYVILEAGLASLPVVVSDLPGIADIIETGMNGIAIEPTSGQLSASLTMLQRDEGMRRRLGEALHQTVSTRFSIDRMQAETYALYSTIKS